MGNRFRSVVILPETVLRGTLGKSSPLQGQEVASQGMCIRQNMTFSSGYILGKCSIFSLTVSLFLILEKYT